jgi:hypothetical protein
MADAFGGETIAGGHRLTGSIQAADIHLAHRIAPAGHDHQRNSCFVNAAADGQFSQTQSALFPAWSWGTLVVIEALQSGFADHRLAE